MGMDDLFSGGDGGGSSRKTFLNHVFDTSDESRALLFNIFQYSFLAIIPVLLLNKVVQQWIPEIDISASSLQITLEIILQVSIMLAGIILIHRVITYIPTYSGIGYAGDLGLTNGVILIFLIIVLSLQTKLGIKVNILYERVWHFINGTESDDDEEEEKKQKKKSRARHTSSSADRLDTNVPNTFPPLPIQQSNDKVSGGDIRNQGGASGNGIFSNPSFSGSDIMPANSLLGGFSGLF